MVTAIILAAGNGKRMQIDTRKPLVKIAGKTMLEWTLTAVSKLEPTQTIVVVPNDAREFKEICQEQNIIWAPQTNPNGTADAVKAALAHTKVTSDKTLILCADVPFVQASDLESLIREDNLAILTMIPNDPGSLGRVKRTNAGNVSAIVEAKDANADELAIAEVFSGIMQVPTQLLREFLDKVDNNNAQGEYYLTDIISFANKKVGSVTANLAMPSWTVTGINNLVELAALERNFYQHRANELLHSGVRIIDPQRFDCRGELNCGKNVTIDINVICQGLVTIGDNCYIGPGCVLENCTIGANTVIQANSVISNSHIAENAKIGPFAYLRPGCEIAENCRIGSFVEIKNSQIGFNSKVPHLSYIGDTKIGKFVNIGAGVITCNYDGQQKHKTKIDDYCFIGAGVQLIAPITINKAAVIGAGTCLRQDLPKQALAVNNYQVKLVENWRQGD